MDPSTAPTNVAVSSRSRALPEGELRSFLRRRRRGSDVVQPAALAAWLGETLDLATRLVPSQAGALLLDDPEHGRKAPLTFVAAFGPTSDRLIGMRIPAGKGIAGQVYRSGQTYASDEPHDDPYFIPRVDELAAFRTRSVVAAPVRLEQSVCGVFELMNRRGRASFSERDVALAEVFAGYVSRAILNAVDILKQNELALRDELTGVRNVRGLEPFLERAINDAGSEGDVSVLFIDVDRLKRINDKFGHRAGSEILKRTAGALESALQSRGVPFRFGGDEFVVICPGATMKDGEHIADALREEVKHMTPGPMPEGGGDLPGVSVSIGVATLARSLGDHPGSLDANATPSPASRLLAAADKALFRAKRTGRGRNARATRRDDTLRMKAIKR